jgi:manganese oxidase
MGNYFSFLRAKKSFTGDKRMITRRKFLSGTAAAAGGMSLLRSVVSAPAQTISPTATPVPLAQPGRDYTPTITPNNVSLPWKIVDGAKVYHLVAEEVKHEFAPGLEAYCWGFNGRVHGPTIEAVEGDRVRIYVTNKLPAATSIHWHGIILPNGMDGVSGLTQTPIKPGETFKYEFTLKQHGTHMYHSHHDEMTQMALGLMGLFIIHPRNPKYRVDRDFAFMLSEWRIDTGTMRPNPNEMTDFNVFSMNARIFPGTEPMVAKLGDRVRIRFVNLSAMDHHPMHLHGHTIRVVETDGGQIPESAQQIETTVLVQVGSARVMEFIADNPGDWPVHCHMTHHTMTQMGDKFPNMIGVKPGKLDEKIRSSLLPGYMTMGENGMADMGTMGMPIPRNSLPMMGGPGPFDYIAMGGMFTVIKIREGITSYEDPGWYRNPEGTVASVAAADDLRRDGVEVQPGSKHSKEHMHHG